jgi:hypothetical protein
MKRRSQLLEFTQSIQDFYNNITENYLAIDQLLPIQQLDEHTQQISEKIPGIRIPNVSSEAVLRDIYPVKRTILNGMITLTFKIPLTNAVTLKEYSIVTNPLKNKARLSNGRLVAKIVTDNSNSSFFWPDQEMELYQ